MKREKDPNGEKPQCRELAEGGSAEANLSSLGAVSGQQGQFWVPVPAQPLPHESSLPYTCTGCSVGALSLAVPGRLEKYKFLFFLLLLNQCLRDWEQEKPVWSRETR